MTPPDPLLALQTRAGLPDALRVLAKDLPRAQWEAHPNFGEMVQFWMQRHAMFRQVSDILRADAAARMDARMAPEDYAARLSHYGGMLLRELQTHHHVEDSHYFPQLITLDARLEKGFDLLERDHSALDGVLHSMADATNTVLTAGAAQEPVGLFSECLTDFATLLERHLTDEEEIVVPVILKTGFSG
ncbi:MAG: hemerythrin domain-containing protein [Roseobacter sp.]